MRCLWNTHMKLPETSLKRHFFQFQELWRKAMVRETGTHMQRPKRVCEGQWKTRKVYIGIAVFLRGSLDSWMETTALNVPSTLGHTDLKTQNWQNLPGAERVKKQSRLIKKDDTEKASFQINRTPCFLKVLQNRENRGRPALRGGPLSHQGCPLTCFALLCLSPVQFHKRKDTLKLSWMSAVPLIR